MYETEFGTIGEQEILCEIIEEETTFNIHQHKFVNRETLSYFRGNSKMHE